MISFSDGVARRAVTVRKPEQPPSQAEGLIPLSDGWLFAAAKDKKIFEVPLWKGQTYTLPVASIDWERSTVEGVTLLWS